MRDVASDEGVCYMLHVVLERQKASDVFGNCIVAERHWAAEPGLTLIKGVCLVCRPLSCFPTRAGRQMCSKEFCITLLPITSTVPEAL